MALSGIIILNMFLSVVLKFVKSEQHEYYEESSDWHSVIATEKNIKKTFLYFRLFIYNTKIK